MRLETVITDTDEGRRAAREFFTSPSVWSLLTAPPPVVYPTLLDRILPWRRARIQREAEERYVRTYVEDIAPNLTRLSIETPDIRDIQIETPVLPQQKLIDTQASV